MAAPVRIVLLALCAGLALMGLALGAESQREFVLESDLAAQGDIASGAAAGNLVILTGLLVAMGASGCVLLLSRGPRLRRVGWSSLFGTAVYGGVVLGQSMWPNYTALVDFRLAHLTNSLLAPNLPAAPSVLLAPLALVLLALLVAGWSLLRLFGPPAGQALAPRAALREHAAAALLATPFLAIVAAGNLRLLLALPADRPGLGPYFVVLPAIALGCIALAVLAAVKTWRLGAYVRNARLAASAQESWQALGRAEATIVALLAGLAIAGSFLAPLRLDDDPATARDEGPLNAGGVLGMTLRVHTQLVVLLAIPLAPILFAHRRVARLLDGPPPHAGNLEDRTDPVAGWSAGVAAGSFAVAGLATFTIGPAGWAWVLAILPCAALAAAACGPRASAPLVLVGAFVLWCIGNTVQAVYDGSTGSAVLSFATAPGVLALWRTLAAVAAGATLARLARGLTGPRLALLPLSAGAGLALGAVALLEMPLTAWLINRPGVDAIAVGSVVASLDPPVRAIVHTVATVLALAAAILVALLHRPEWFARRPRRPVAVVRVKRAGAAAGQPANAPA